MSAAIVFRGRFGGRTHKLHMQHMARVVETNKLLLEALDSSKALVDSLFLQLKATEKLQNSAKLINDNVTRLNTTFACVNADQAALKAGQGEITRALAIIQQGK